MISMQPSIIYILNQNPTLNIKIQTVYPTTFQFQENSNFLLILLTYLGYVWFVDGFEFIFGFKLMFMFEENNKV